MGAAMTAKAAYFALIVQAMFGSVKSFADGCGAKITVMEGGEHWFHTPAQMRFLDNWIKNCFEE